MSTSERVQLWAMRGLTAAEITHQTKLPRSTVKYHLKRFKETGSWSRREYPVRVKTLTPFAECIRKHLKLHPHASATELHELLASKYQLLVSVRTVQRYLKSAGREQNRREDGSEAEEDSDTSTTEELSVASGSERSASPKLKQLDTQLSARIPLPNVQESRFNAERMQNKFGAPSNFVRHAPVAHPLFHPHAGAMPMHPPMLQTPYGFFSPYGLLAQAPTLPWQPDAQSAVAGVGGFPLIPTGPIPRGLLPLYPQFNQTSSESLVSGMLTPAFLTPTPFAAATSSSAPVAPFAPNPEPGLEALLNAALVHE